MNATRIQVAKRALILLPLLLTFGAKSAIAQITPAIDGTGTIVQTQINQINISGGTQAGNNQFHSFQQFGVNAGQTANFISNPNIANILGRVTGGNASLINGILQVSGSNANLFLINPSGIVFGKDASLNVPAAFTATTANGIGFGTGNWWSAVGSNNYENLTANPTSFGFLGASGSLVNAGNLSVNPGQSIALVGGTVVNTGTIAAPGGNITIAAIPGEKMVRIGQAGTILSLDLPMSDQAAINAPIATPLSLPALLTGGSIPEAMGVVVENGVTQLTSGSASVNGTINADGTGVQNGGNAIVYADKHLNFGGTISAKGGELGGNGGFVDTSGKGSIAIAPNAKVVTTAPKGSTGTWLIDPADLEVVEGTGGAIGDGGSTIGAGTIVTALDTTNVNLQADRSITVNAAIDTSANNNNNNDYFDEYFDNYFDRGRLTLTAPTVNLNQAITLSNSRLGYWGMPGALSGTATTVNVGALGTVQNGVDVAAAGGTVNLAAATYTIDRSPYMFDRGGYIDKNLTVQGAGASRTIVSGNNATKIFEINWGRTVTLDGLSIVNGNGYNGGGILNYGTLTVSNSILSGNNATNHGGGLFNRGMLTVSNSTLSGNTSINSYGGGIYNEGTLIVSNSTLSGNKATDYGFGGGIFNERGILTVTNSTLSGNSVDRDGGGLFNRGTLTMSNSTLSGNSAVRDGGGLLNALDARPSTVSNSTFSGNSAISGGGIYNDSPLTVSNSTLSGNSANSQGGGIYNKFDTGTLTIGSSIVSGNNTVVVEEGREFWGLFTSNGYNLFGHGGNNGLAGGTGVGPDITPTAALSTLLAPLGNYGGATQTHALLPGSAAIDTGNDTPNTLDQRGNARVGRADIGAFESQGFNFATSAGTPQNITVDKAAVTPLTVKVTAVNPIEPVAGGLVNFTAPNATIAEPATSTLSSTTATIDESGNASVIATANTKIGTYTVRSNIAGITPTADFTLTNIADVPNAIEMTSGSGQRVVVDTNFTNLVATVTDRFGNPVKDSTVTFSVPTTDASGIFATSNTATTDENGVATIAIKANTKVGGFTAKGGVSGVTGTADFALTNLVGAASQIKTTDGSGQRTVVDTNFRDLVATVTDKFDNPIENATVTFTVPETDASGIFTPATNIARTGADGKATIGIKANTKAGEFTAIGNVTNVSQSADFALTNTADKPTQVIPTIVGASSNTALQVKLLDQYGNPVNNNAVTLTLPNYGANGEVIGGTTSIVLTTDTNGIITTPLPANATPGTFNASIQVNGSPQIAQFTFTKEATPTPTPTPKTPDLKSIDPTRSLETTPKARPIPSIAPPESILCIEGLGSAGAATCGATETKAQ